MGLEGPTMLELEEAQNPPNYIHTMEYYSVFKRKEVLTHATAWMELEDILLSEINQTQRDKYCTIHLDEVPRAVGVIETEENGGWGSGLGSERNGDLPNKQ